MSTLLDDNDDFKNYLKQQVKNHRIYPADNIWRNIQTTLHGERSWPALSAISICIIACLTIGTIFIKPNDNLPKSQYHPVVFVNNILASEKQSKASSEILRQHISPENITQQTISAVANDLGISPDAQVDMSITYHTVPYADVSNELVSVKKEIPAAANFTKLHINVYAQADPAEKIEADSRMESNENASYLRNAIMPGSPFSFMQPLPKKQSRFFMQSSLNMASSFVPSYNHNYIKLNFWHSLPSTNNFGSAKPKISKFVVQLYATPSISYRRLVDATTGHSASSFLPASALQQTSNTDINESAHNTPAIGLEAGVVAGYKITDQITLKAGLQFNMQQYNIKAYNNYETQPALYGSLSNISPDTLNLVSNTGSSASATYQTILNNRYYEISLPVGLDWRVRSFKKFSVGVAGFVQPTYTFDKQPFIVATDLKNYINGSSLLRRWNINTSFETYVAYKIGDYTWQIGPQFRYQQLPTFSGQYPIKEYLLDYGIKIGITKSIR